jgi:transcriptional regulator with XRE-family HTH domain
MGFEIVERHLYSPHQPLMKARIGSKLLTIRKERGLTQAEMARILDIPMPVYTCIERNETTLELDRITKYAQTLGIQVQDLIPEPVTMQNAVHNAGYGGGVIFGNQYFYVNDSSQIQKLQNEIEELRKEFSKSPSIGYNSPHFLDS